MISGRTLSINAKCILKFARFAKGRRSVLPWLDNATAATGDFSVAQCLPSALFAWNTSVFPFPPTSSLIKSISTHLGFPLCAGYCSTWHFSSPKLAKVFYYYFRIFLTLLIVVKRYSLDARKTYGCLWRCTTAASFGGQMQYLHLPFPHHFCPFACMKRMSLKVKGVFRKSTISNWFAISGHAISCILYTIIQYCRYITAHIINMYFDGVFRGWGVLQSHSCAQ